MSNRTRAKACELLANKSKEISTPADTAFLAGLLSGANLLLEIDPEYFVSQINLSHDIQLAILKHEGDLGVLLKM